VNNAEISTNTPLGVAAVSTLELSFIRLCQVGHGALELRDDCAWSEGTGSKNTELRFACAMRVPLGVGDLNGASREVEFHVTGGMAVFDEGGLVDCEERGREQDGKGGTNVAKEFISRSVKPLVK